jgi:hypothetical protein
MIKEQLHVSHSDDDAATWRTHAVDFAAATPPELLAERGACRRGRNRHSVCPHCAS